MSGNEAAPRFTLVLSDHYGVATSGPAHSHLLLGFWTDVLVFAGWIVYLLMRPGMVLRWLRWLSISLFGLLISVSLISLGSLGGAFFLIELAETRNVPQQEKLQGLCLVNQYFIPVGAYGCGEGRLITAKALIIFPLFEYRTELDPCTRENWGCYIDTGTWDGCN